MPSIEFISNRNVSNMIDKFEHKACGSGRVSAYVFVSDAVSSIPPHQTRWYPFGIQRLVYTHPFPAYFRTEGDSRQSQIQSPEQFSFGGGGGGGVFFVNQE